MKTIRETSSGLFEICLLHPNGEEKWLPIESWAERWLCVRWGVAGLYDIILKNGDLMARSAKTRAKGAYNPWKAADKGEARQFVADKMGITKEEMERRFDAHHQNMPYVKCGNNAGIIGKANVK